MDETVVNGAQGFYKEDFGIGSQTQRGKISFRASSPLPTYVESRRLMEACQTLGSWDLSTVRVPFPLALPPSGRDTDPFYSCAVYLLCLCGLLAYRAYEQALWPSRHHLRVVPNLGRRLLLAGLHQHMASGPSVAVPTEWRQVGVAILTARQLHRWHMFIARFFLGFGIGPKSATTRMLFPPSSSSSWNSRC